MSLDATGAAFYPPPGSYNFSSLDNYLRNTLKGLIGFSQVPMTFQTSDGSTKFIVNVGLAPITTSP